MSERKQIGEAVTVAWRERPQPAESPIHALTMRDFRVTPFGAFCRAETFCGIAPGEGEPIHSVTEEITCAPCLASMGGDAVDMAQRLLAASREPVAA